MRHVEDFVADIVVEDRVIVEPTCVRRRVSAHEIPRVSRGKPCPESRTGRHGKTRESERSRTFREDKQDS